MLCLCPVEEIIDKDEFVLLYEAHRPSNLPFPHSAYEKFSLAIANKDPAECKGDFRVKKRDIPLLLDTLRVPPVFQCRNGTIWDGIEGLCTGWLHGHMSKTLLTELKEGIKHTKFNKIELNNSSLNVLV